MIPGGSVSALEGLRVVEVGAGVAPAFAGRWLAAFGATLLKVEPPGGSWTRRYSPSGAAPAGAAGPLAAFLDAGKQSAVVDLDTDEGRARLAVLVADADVLVHDLDAARLPLGERRPGLIQVALTPFGSDGPYAGYAATSLVLLALGGYQHLTGEPGREPLMLPGFQPEYLAGLYGVVAALSGVVARLAGDAGRRFEIPVVEALASLHQFTVSQWLYEGQVRSRHGNRWENVYPATMLPCRDGYVALSMPTPEMWVRLCGMLERPDLLADPRFATTELRRRHADELDAILHPWLASRDAAQVVATAQGRWRLPVGRYVELAAVLRDPQCLARGFWVRPAGDPSGPYHPGLPVVMSETPWAIGPPPRPGEPDAGGPRPRPGGAGPAPVVRGAREPAAAPLPLAGLRVLDLTRVWSGPLCTRVLADLGARVVKIEPPPPLAPAGGPEPRPVAGPGKLNRNKLSVGIDLRVPAGRDLLKRLVAVADVLVENFSARVMPGFGLEYKTLESINPGLVYLAMSGFGTTGPYRDHVAYGSISEAMVGLTALLGYPGEPPLNSAIAYPDAVAGLAGAAAVLTGLAHRARTGRGQFLDLSQLEPTAMMLGEFFLACQVEGQAVERAGNAHPEWAPHGAYPCRGDDQWVSLAVRSEVEWAALCRVAGLAALGADPGCATAAGRRARRARVDAAIAAWTRGLDKRDAMERLQRAGVPAGAVLDGRDLVEDPHLRSRGFFVEARTDDGLAYPMPGTPIAVDGGKRQDWRAAPWRGEHNRVVLAEFLSMTDAEIESLRSAGALIDGRRDG
jgi:crotonobetainyl-CoA:carnitine CoA-transferase CaiB-like acyl-CoA transferase